MNKVIIGDNSAILKTFLKDILSSSRLYEVIKMTGNGEEIIKTHNETYADLIIIGEGLSLIDEVETARLIMETKPTIIIILSSKNGNPEIKKALNYKVAAIIEKPNIELINDKEYAKDFLEKINSVVNNKEKNKDILFGLKNKYKDIPLTGELDKKLIVIGASTGGPKILQIIFDNMPKDFPVGIALVQHFEEGFEKGFVEWLNKTSPLNIRLAEKKDFPKPGEVIIAPQGYHLKAEGNYLVLSDGAKVNNQKPSVDVLFSSCAKVYKNNLVGVLLTGMGKDGAEGCVDILKNGGFTIVQDKETSIVYGMPKEAFERGGASIVLPSYEIAPYLIKMFMGH
ncbi:MAG TPA: chemotaxis protein CheB [Spirochaetota bacterium]|nr:chemotaxis protein CheB [Spirochaetota bacterium]HOL56143.1 chemotaxis protein CheB [Spirochaetota bacterium]HPP03996.1 chemotaxis protein CheB [Spirochaetota bacterium]